MSSNMGSAVNSTPSQSYGVSLAIYGITQFYLPPDISEHAPPNASHTGWYSIYLPRRDGRLSWPSWLDSTPAKSQTSDLSITSPTPNRCTTKTNTQNYTEIISHVTTQEHKFLLHSCCAPALPM